ncbi:HNH endonuclease, partial [Clostridium estertheticum]|uniref:HNH endonuclease n=2 Tax=Clostridium estertheticum TaxID=238834 RepID=UPI001CF42D07
IKGIIKLGGVTGGVESLIRQTLDGKGINPITVIKDAGKGILTLGLLHGAGKLFQKASPFVKKAFNKIASNISSGGKKVLNKAANSLDNMLDGVSRKADELVYNMNKSLNFQPKLAGVGDIYLPPEESKFFKNQISKITGKGGAEGVDEATGRLNMAGKTHPVSGVQFDANGFPKFKSEYDTNLDPADYLKSRGTHFDRAGKSLYDEIQNNSELASKFTQNEIAIFKEGGVPKRFTWHHNQEPGLMELVDRTLHRQTGHNGGFSIWGPGNK